MTNLQMKYADINRRFTEIVAEWLTKGYTINTATMNGSQGENAKLDLTDGKKIVRILVARFSEHAANVEGIEIVAGEATDAKVIPNGSDNWATIWNNNLKVLQRERFFKMGENQFGDVQYGTEVEAKAAAELRFKRYIAKKITRKHEITSDKAVDIAKRIIRREFGVKRIIEADVSVFKRNDADGTNYYVSYRNKTYRLH